MKIVLKVLGGLGALVALLLLLIVLCHYNPGLSEDLGQTIARLLPTNTETALEPERIAGNTQKLVTMPKSEENGEGTFPQEGLDLDALQTAYVEPMPDDLQIDALVSFLNGLQSIEDVGETIPQERANEIKNTLSVGETGEGLDWDAEMYPYYAMLDSSAKELYRQIYANMEAYTTQFKPIHDTNKNELKNAFTAVCNDQPQLFYIKTGYGYKQDLAGKIVEIDLAYLMEEGQIGAAREQLEASARPIIEKASQENSNYNKEVVVHDALMERNTYNKSAPMNQSAYSALVNGQTVCAGYARAFQYLCMELGIPCYYCTGYAGENHAWNIIQLEEDYYNVDVTWDDTQPNTHNYFNCSDARYAKDHIRRELSIYLPPCNGEKYSDLIVDVEMEEPETQQSAVSVPEEVLQESVSVESEEDDEQEEKVPLTELEKEQSVEETEAEKTTELVEEIDVNKTAESVEEYYKLCRANLMANTQDEMTFTIKIKDKLLWQAIRQGYQNQEYMDGYAQQVLKDKSRDACTVDVEMERLTGGIYELRHTVKFS